MPLATAGFYIPKEDFGGLQGCIHKGVRRVLKGSSTLLAQHKSIPWWDGGARMLTDLAGVGNQLEQGTESF